jgi:hypothetical protein
MNVVLDNSHRSRRDAILKGSPGGENPTFCGVLVIPTQGDNTILITKPPLERCFVHPPSGKLLVQRENTYYGFTDSETCVSRVVRPWAEVVPPTMSYWRNTQVPGSSLQVVGTDLDRQGCLIILGSEQGEKVPFTKMRDDYVRFDRSAAPNVGSIWQQRGGPHIYLVTKVDVQADLVYVGLRPISAQHFVQDAGDGRLLPVPDLWRNYAEVQAECQSIPAEVIGEWEMEDGRSAYVLKGNPEFGTVQVVIESVDHTVLVKAFANWSKVERMTAFERLMDD